MADFTAEFDVRDVEKGFRKLEAFGGSRGLRKVLFKLRGPLRADQRAHAKAETGPDGQKWPGRAASTVAAIKKRRAANKRTRAAGGKKRSFARKLLGRLPGQLDVRVEGKSLVARSKVRWAPAQRDGLRVGHGSQLPARDWLYISEDMLIKSAAQVVDAMPGEFGP